MSLFHPIKTKFTLTRQELKDLLLLAGLVLTEDDAPTEEIRQAVRKLQRHIQVHTRNGKSYAHIDAFEIVR